VLARLPRTTLVLLLAFAVAATAVVVGLRSAASEASLAEERQARTEFARDMGELRRSLSVPAHTARTSTAALRLNMAELVTGSDRDAASIAQDREDLVDQLRQAADQLDAHSDIAAPAAHEDLPAETVEPALDRLEGLDEQARWVAGQLRAAADDVEQWATVAEELRESTEALLALDAPGTDDPDELADRWREELETLGPYREAAEKAADREDLAALGEAHLQLIDGLEDVAEQAIERLDDGDVDGYNQLLDEELSDEDPFGFGEALDDAVSETLGDGPIAEVEEAQERTLGLLAELEQLRRSTPARSAV
jgi:hypothetical protein